MNLIIANEMKKNLMQFRKYSAVNFKGINWLEYLIKGENLVLKDK